MTTATLTRELPIEEVHNVRHIGGYQTRDGRRTSAQIIRAAGLSRMPAAAVAQMRAHGVRTVIDLRSSKELEEMPTPALDGHGIRHVHAPVFESDASPVGLADKPFPGFAKIYARFLESGRDAYRVLAETVAETSDGLLYHCAAGKDRTGVATALLLDLAGVPDEQILEDHAQSARLLAPMLPKWKEGMAERGMDPARAEVMLASDPADIHALLLHLRDRWGDAEGYFQDIGVSVTTIRRVRERVIEG
jgi:protein-tyrosine phosphatase